MPTSARLLEDVVAPSGDRLTIFEVELHRFVLAELNTHRSHSRSSASSRAIPVSKQIARVKEDPAWPLVWTSEQPGMQGGSELEGYDLGNAQWLFKDVQQYTVDRIEDYYEDLRRNYGEEPSQWGPHALHKSLVNRLMEPFMWHKVIFGATDLGWVNFFAQRAMRYSPLAQPELRAAADQMLDIYGDEEFEESEELRAVAGMMMETLESSTPTQINFGEWVTPYIQRDEKFLIDTKLKVSVGRCARVSFLNHGGIRDLDADLKLWSTLSTSKPKHAAPMEFVCTPMGYDEEQVGNFRGFRQLRHMVERGEFA